MNRCNTGAVLILMATAAAAGPSDDDMARCAAISATDARVACYDALAHRPADKPSAAARSTPAPGPALAAPAPASAATGPAAAPVPAPAAAAPVAQAPVSVAAIAADPKTFGLTPAQKHIADLGPKSMAAHISSVRADQLGRTFVVLDEGGTWSVLDNDGRLSSGDAVTIKRAAMSSFLMFTATNHSYSVHRIK
jgi:hypothetical protein